MKRWLSWAWWVLVLLPPVLSSGCVPYSMGVFTPIPVFPWVTERMEEKYAHLNDYRTPLLPPIREGFPPPTCDDPPDDSQVLRALKKVARGVPYFYEEFRDDIQIVTELIRDVIDPPRFYPLVGPAQQHHCHWKCTVYYMETIEACQPFAYQIRRPRVQVVYIDKNHLHAYPSPIPEVQRQFTRDLIGQ